QLGRQGLEAIEGEFALVVWDGPGKRLWAQRDPMGCWPLFWSTRKGAVAVSTSLGALVDEQPGRSFNLDALAEFLMQPTPADELASEETAFQGVQRVRPGTIVELTTTGAVRRHVYWDWDSRIGRTEVATLEEAGAGFAWRLRQAVQQRVPERGHLAAHLSGGMDSSSIVCLARDVVSARSGSPLFTLSLVYRRRSLAGERAYMDQVLSQGGPLAPQFLEGDQALFFDWFERGLPHHEEPCGVLPSMPPRRLLVEAADRLGAAMILSGEGSDEIVTFQPYHLADLLRRGRWLTALKEASRWSLGRRFALGSVFQYYGLVPLCPLWSREGWGPLFRNGYGTWPRLGLFSVPPWVRPEFARRHHLRERGRAHARRIFADPSEVSWRSFTLQTSSGDWERWHLAAPLGLNLSHPFRDPRLIRFTLGLPRRIRGVPGMVKPVLETAMRGVLPAEILTRKWNTGFDDVYGLGLRRNLPSLEQLILNENLGELGIIDTRKLIPILHQAALGIGDTQATDRLDKTLALAAWIAQFEGRRTTGETDQTRWLDREQAGPWSDIAAEQARSDAANLAPAERALVRSCR
ncbi:MAG TPA: asparagine synthase-related protein, partial [Isosphaeraceae bacterium]|nr:asparagine synthase-related protein [Isosphaeraceae bacterium]